jgi:hypothetical protein
VNILLVTFSLRNVNKDYSQFFVALRGNAHQWWHFIEQTCIVTTFHDVNAFTDLLLPHMERTDSVLVVKITPHQYQGWLPPSAWEWLTKVATDINQLSLPQIFPPLPKKTS